MGRPSDELHSFSAGGYEVFDEDFADTGRVVIWSRMSREPQLGDRFNIESRGEVHELAVDEIRTFAGGWSVTCRRDQP